MLGQFNWRKKMPKRIDRVPERNAGDCRVSVVHATSIGMVHLLVTRSKNGGWNARMWGVDAAILRYFPALNDANGFLMDRFSRRYPRHRCSPRCVPLYTRISGTDRVVRIHEFNAPKL